MKSYRHELYVLKNKNGNPYVLLISNDKKEQPKFLDVNDIEDIINVLGRLSMAPEELLTKVAINVKGCNWQKMSRADANLCLKDKCLAKLVEKTK